MYTMLNSVKFILKTVGNIWRSYLKDQSMIRLIRSIGENKTQDCSINPRREISSPIVTNLKKLFGREKKPGCYTNSLSGTWSLCLKKQNLCCLNSIQVYIFNRLEDLEMTRVIWAGSIDCGDISLLDMIELWLWIMSHRTNNEKIKKG